MSRPIIGTLLQHGKFTAANADLTARALTGLSLGLVGYSIYLFALRGFYAHQDTRTPFLINVVQNIINIILAFALVSKYDVLGLGIAFAVSYLVGAVIALLTLQIKVRTFPAVTLLMDLLRMFSAAIVMGIVLWFIIKPVGENSGLGALLRIAFGTVSGTVIYFGALTLLKVPEASYWRTLTRGLFPLRHTPPSDDLTRQDD